jgi:hypothetical protein
MLAALAGATVAGQAQVDAAQWVAAMNGSPQGQGTAASPWDLATALAGGPNRATIRPGDLLWLRGGTYPGAFVSTLAGTPEAPIVVRAFPGERPRLDRAQVSEAKQPALKVKGPCVWFWGLEITNSHLDRSAASPYSGDDEPWRGSGADVYAPQCKFINMVFHDNGHGIWDKQDMTEVHGCLFYYNGNNKREHALYLGNSQGTKVISDNIVFAQGGYGILCHSDSTSSRQNGLHLEGNVAFHNGVLSAEDQTTGNLQVGGVNGVPARGITIKSNHIYNAASVPKNKNYGIRLGYEDKNNQDVRLVDNYIVSRVPLRLWWWQSVQATGNTIYSPGGTSVELKLPVGGSSAGYQWNLNTYWSGRSSGPTFKLESTSYTFPNWQTATGLDRNSQVWQTASLRPTGTRVFVRTNRYEAGRAHVVVYNWDLRPAVPVNVGGVLPVGATYEVYDAQNYFGGPVARGTFTGAPISLPMNLTAVSVPIGNVARRPTHTSSEFGVFILRRIS